MTFARTVVLSMVIAGVAAAEAPGPSRSHTEVAKVFARGEFEEAIKRADLALKKETEPLELARLQVLRAQAFLALGQTDRARAAFAAAVQKDPAVELDTTRAGPEAVRMLERVRAELPATLVVKVKTEDAEVAIDDRDLGPAPLQTQVAGGIHVVVARGPDGRTTRVDAKVPPGRKVVLELELEGAARPAPPVDEGPRSPSKSAELTVTPPPPSTPSGEVALSIPPLVRGPQPLDLGLLIGGGALAIAGAVSLGVAVDLFNQLKTRTTFPPGGGEKAAVTGNTLQILGWVGVGVGVAAAAVGGYFAYRHSQPLLAIVPTQGGIMVGVSGSLPSP